MRSRMRPILLVCDNKQAFLHIVIREIDQDVTRVLWINDLQQKEMVVHRMTRTIFGRGPSPF